MAVSGAEPIGSMGNDAALAFVSERPRALYDYFTQLFAQVTNPPLDAIREELVTSLECQLGSEQNLLAPGPASCRKVVLPFPVLSNDELAKIIHINDDGEHPGFASYTVRGVFPAAEGWRPACSGGSGRSPRRSRRRSRTAPGSSCCPAAASTRTTRRSRRCCSPARCTSTWSRSARAPGSG